VLPNGAIGARFSADGDTLYLTDAGGLGIYDFANPDSPQIRSHIPLPRIDVAGALHLVDVSDPAAPVIRETRPSGNGLTVYDVRDLSRPAAEPSAREEELAWVCGEDGTFAFDVTDPARPRLVLGGPGGPHLGHRRLVRALTRPERRRAWPNRGAPVGFYASAGSIWGAYLAPADCPPLGGRAAERTTLSPTGESGRPASWGRGPVLSPLVS
jgi:LVIVD repeat